MSHLKCPSAADFLERMQGMLTLAKKRIQQAADRAKSYADQHRTL